MPELDISPDPVTTIVDRLRAVDEHRLSRLGFRADDQADALRVIGHALEDAQTSEAVSLLADRLRGSIGDFTGSRNDDHGGPLEHPAAADRGEGNGVIPMLALIATAPDVVKFHADRGIPGELSQVVLTDLGQQAWVHRRTYGDFGLHTYKWLQVAWSGALYWLGRLQFNLLKKGQDWVLSTHIPERGPLRPDLVADAFGRARTFFATYFPDHPTRLFHCNSWLLDPQLADVLAPGSNMVWFQRLWQLWPDPRNGDADALFFVFHRRGDVDRATLPRETSLQRAILDKIENGGQWQVREGVIDQDQFPAVELDADGPVATRDSHPTGEANQRR